MIRNIKHKGLQVLFEKDNAKGVPAAFARKIRMTLLALQQKPLPDVVDLPGFGLHALTGDRKGTWSITISKNWRITFETDGTDAFNVDFEDYH